MRVLIVTFQLKNMSDREYRQAAESVAANFAAVPGLERKYWLVDEASNTYGGAYLFESAAALTAYLQSDLAAPLNANPHFTNVSSREFGLVEAATAVTLPGEALAA